MQCDGGMFRAAELARKCMLSGQVATLRKGGLATPYINAYMESFVGCRWWDIGRCRPACRFGCGLIDRAPQLPRAYLRAARHRGCSWPQKRLRSIGGAAAAGNTNISVKALSNRN